MPDSPLHWRRVKLTDQTAGAQAEFLPECSPHLVDCVQDAMPLEILTSIWTDDFPEFICKETKRYAQQIGKHTFTMDKEARMKFLGILILSDYIQLPQRRTIWERAADTNNAAVTANTSADRFPESLRYLPFNNNQNLNKDKAFSMAMKTPERRLHQLLPLVRIEHHGTRQQRTRDLMLCRTDRFGNTLVP